MGCLIKDIKNLNQGGHLEFYKSWGTIYLHLPDPLWSVLSALYMIVSAHWVWNDTSFTRFTSGLFLFLFKILWWCFGIFIFLVFVPKLNSSFVFLFSILVSLFQVNLDYQEKKTGWKLMEVGFEPKMSNSSSVMEKGYGEFGFFFFFNFSQNFIYHHFFGITFLIFFCLILKMFAL